MIAINPDRGRPWAGGARDYDVVCLMEINRRCGLFVRLKSFYCPFTQLYRAFFMATGCRPMLADVPRVFGHGNGPTEGV